MGTVTNAEFMTPLLAQGVCCLFGEVEVHEALQRMASKINAEYASAEPVLVLGVMNGALVTLGQLLPKLSFPLHLDYVHATRYNQGEAGGSLDWRRKPEKPLEGCQVLIVDDILDQGITLAAIVDYCRRAGASEVKTAVLARKQLPSAPVVEADFVALQVPDEYVFGFGMDYRGLWRNLPGIYALPPRG
jgi:hypoxanthine phosphoribosyltransferase